MPDDKKQKPKQDTVETTPPNQPADSQDTNQFVLSPMMEAIIEKAKETAPKYGGVDIDYSTSVPVEIQAQDIGEWNRAIAIPTAQAALQRQSQLEDFVSRYNQQIDMWHQIMRGASPRSTIVQQTVGSPWGIGEYGGYILTGGKLAPPQFQAPPNLFKRVEVKDQKEKFGFKINNKPETGGYGGFGGQRSKPYLNITIGNKGDKDTYTVGKDVLLPTAFEKVAYNAFNPNDYLAGVSPNWEILLGIRDTNVNNLGNIGNMIKQGGGVIPMNFDINKNNKKYTITVSIDTKSKPINTVSDLYGSIFDAFNKNDELSDQTYELRQLAGTILNQSADNLKNDSFNQLMQRSMKRIFSLTEKERQGYLSALYNEIQNFANKLVSNGSAMKFFQQAFNKADRHLRLLWGNYNVQGSYVTLDAFVKDGILAALTSMTWADILPER